VCGGGRTRRGDISRFAAPGRDFVALLVSGWARQKSPRSGGPVGRRERERARAKEGKEAFRWARAPGKAIGSDQFRSKLRSGAQRKCWLGRFLAREGRLRLDPVHCIWASFQNCFWPWTLPFVHRQTATTRKKSRDDLNFKEIRRKILYFFHHETRRSRAKADANLGYLNWSVLNSSELAVHRIGI
jgi:hypothetical protein